MLTSQDKKQVFDSLPRPLVSDWVKRIRHLNTLRPTKLVVLDDDPTGTQTVANIPVLTEWGVQSLREEFANSLPCFYLLTNSRSLPEETAGALNSEIARNLKLAAGGHQFRVVSRSDSTLRGHFPLETEILSDELGPFDGLLFAPYFEAGGRYTIDDVHYVAEEGQLVPAGETPFAGDATFGYRSSNLRDWVEEKTKGTTPATQVTSIGLDVIRLGGVEGVQSALEALGDGQVCVVNAAHPSDLDLVMVAMLQAESTGKRFLFRSGAQVVSSLLGLGDISPWRPGKPEDGSGGLIVVGSHVPKSSLQLEYLLQDDQLHAIELDVTRLLVDPEAVVRSLIPEIESALKQDERVVLFTSRQVIVGGSPEASLAISAKVSEVLVRLVKQLEVRPRFIVAKGGITSSDLATKGLGAKRAMVRGPILPGVPVWELGNETRFPGVPYVVFPGNVGGVDALAEVVRVFDSSTKAD